ncbi:hypothetical protein E2C01_019517 [Portunus trituberculatus]|uniref:Uncharacterized protein n=1 Tax=Portunus trituberculatus TaxID=210409 RepID=A0A5B7DZL7_PORTR|nr:hypothetical protein [Portunus trituberculatus]
MKGMTLVLSLSFSAKNEQAHDLLASFKVPSFNPGVLTPFVPNPRFTRLYYSHQWEKNDYPFYNSSSRTVLQPRSLVLPLCSVIRDADLGHAPIEHRTRGVALRLL